jgi:hypothetical protein
VRTETASQPIVSGANGFTLSDFTNVDLAHIRQVDIALENRSGLGDVENDASARIVDVSAVSDPSPGSGLPAPSALAPANGGSAPAQNTAFSWSPVTGATGYRLVVASDASALPDDPAAPACAGCSFVRTTTLPAYAHDAARRRARFIGGEFKLCRRAAGATPRSSPLPEASHSRSPHRHLALRSKRHR